MPKCKSCGEKWSWKDTFSKMIRFRHEITCSYCGENQYVTSSSRKRMGSICLIPLLALLPLNMLELTLPFSIVTLCILSIIVIAISPFSMELTNRDVPLW